VSENREAQEALDFVRGVLAEFVVHDCERQWRCNAEQAEHVSVMFGRLKAVVDQSAALIAALAERDALLKDLLAALKEAREWIYEDVQANDPNDRDETARLRAISLSLRTRIDSLLNREVGL
jgi:hypothetical protein